MSERESDFVFNLDFPYKKLRNIWHNWARKLEEENIHLKQQMQELEATINQLEERIQELEQVLAEIMDDIEDCTSYTPYEQLWRVIKSTYAVAKTVLRKECCDCTDATISELAEEVGTEGFSGTEGGK